MTQEQIELLNEILEREKTLTPITIALYIVCILLLVAFIAITIQSTNKKKKYRRDWIATLTDEQRKAVEESKKFNF